MFPRNATNSFNVEIKDNKSQFLNLSDLNELEKIIFNLTENILQTVQQSMNLFNTNYQYSFNIVINVLVFSAFCAQNSVNEKYLNYLQLIQEKEEEINKKTKIITMLARYIFGNKKQEPYYLLEMMIEKI